MNIYIHNLFLAFLNSGKTCHGSPGRNKYRVAEVARIVRTDPQQRYFVTIYPIFKRISESAQRLSLCFGIAFNESQQLDIQYNMDLKQHQSNYNQKLHQAHR